MLASRCLRAAPAVKRASSAALRDSARVSAVFANGDGLRTQRSRNQSTLKSYDLFDASKAAVIPPVAIPKRSSSLAQAVDEFNFDEHAFRYFNESMYTITDAIVRSRTTKEYMRQIRSEQEQQQQAIDRYREEINQLLRIGKGTSFKSVEHFLVGWYEPFVREIEAECAQIRDKVPGVDRREYGPCLLLLPPDKLAVITMHTVLNHVLMSANKGASLTKVLTAIGECVQAEVNALKLQSNGEALANTLQGLAAVKVVNRRARKLLAAEEWPSWLMVKLGAVLTKMLLNSAKMESGRPAFTHTINCKNDKKYGLLKCDDLLYQLISQKDFDKILPAYLPMHTEPMPWTDVNKGAYLLLQSSLMRTRSRSQLTALRAADLSRIYEGLNALGRVPWQINSRVLDVVNEVWQTGGGVADVPSRTDLPAPDPTAFTDESGNLNKSLYNEMVKRTKMKNADLHSLRCDMNLKLKVAEKFRNDVMYFPFNLDFRGRAYPIPPHLNHLGSDVCRGLLQFARGKPLGPRGLFWLKVHLANLFGVNKISLDDRAAWTDSHMHLVHEMARNPLGDNRWWLSADEPWQALATCFEIANAVNSGDPESYVTHMPVHQDGSCNGLQHYAALGRDGQGGKAVNLVPNNMPQDVYKGVCDIVAEKVAKEAARELPPDASEMERREHRCAVWLNGKVDRKVVKQTVMTSVYGVTFVGAREQIYARLKEKAVPDSSTIITPEMEHDLKACSMYLTTLTLGAIRELFSNAREIMDWLANVARLVASTGHPVSWVTPLGLPVAQPYRKSERHVVKTLMQNIVLTTDADALPIAPRQQRSAFPPNFVHSLDSTHMLMTAIEMERLGLDFTAVHDSYWTHPSEVDTMNDVLRDQFVELYSQPILESLRSSIIARHPGLEIPEIPPRGNLDLEQVRNSTYFFA